MPAQMQEIQSLAFFRLKPEKTGFPLKSGNFSSEKSVKNYLAKRKAHYISLHYAKATFNKKEHQKSNAKIVFTLVKNCGTGIAEANSGETQISKCNHK